MLSLSSVSSDDEPQPICGGVRSRSYLLCVSRALDTKSDRRARFRTYVRTVLYLYVEIPTGTEIDDAFSFDAVLSRPSRASPRHAPEGSSSFLDVGTSPSWAPELWVQLR